MWNNSYSSELLFWATLSELWGEGGGRVEIGSVELFLVTSEETLLCGPGRVCAGLCVCVCVYVCMCV